MTGRELHRKFSQLGGFLDSELKDNWYRLGASEQLAWEDLAEWVEKQPVQQEQEQGVVAG